MNEIFTVTNMSNREFLETFARPGRIGLAGGSSWIDRAIKHVERHVDEAAQPSLWSHAYLFEGRRVDGHQWVIESDIQIAHKHISLGVQENRLAKYFDEAAYPTLAVLDFGVSDDQLAILLREGLELVAGRARYSLRELVGTIINLRRTQRTGRENPLAREGSFYCSAFVQHLFRKAGVDLAPGLDAKNTTPEDLSRSTAARLTYLLRRVKPISKISKLTKLAVKVRRGLRPVKAKA